MYMHSFAVVTVHRLWSGTVVYLWIIDNGWASTVSVLLELAVQLTLQSSQFLVDTLHIGVDTPFQPVSDVRRMIDLRTTFRRRLNGPRHGRQTGVLDVYLHNGVWCSARLRRGRSTSVVATGVTSFQYRLHLIRCLLFRELFDLLSDFWHSSAYRTVFKQTRNSSGDEIANVNFLYDDIVHALKMQ